MPDYRRAWYPGGTYFFTVNLLQRHGNDLLVRHIASLRESVRTARVGRNNRRALRRMFICPHLEWCNALRLLHPTTIASNGMRHISKSLS
jgi:hypothetical protein